MAEDGSLASYDAPGEHALQTHKANEVRTQPASSRWKRAAGAEGKGHAASMLMPNMSSMCDVSAV